MDSFVYTFNKPLWLTVNKAVQAFLNHLHLRRQRIEKFNLPSIRRGVMALK
jgi:hypothetical protein